MAAIRKITVSVGETKSTGNYESVKTNIAQEWELSNNDLIQGGTKIRKNVWNKIYNSVHDCKEETLNHEIAKIKQRSADAYRKAKSGAVYDYVTGEK